MSGINFESDTLLEPIAIFIEPICFYADLIEKQFSDLLLPPAPGIYRVGDIQPLLDARRQYFVQKIVDGRIQQNPITNFSEVEDSVVDETGKLVISAHFMKNKQKYLSNQPTIPARGLEIVRCMIDDHIAKINPWAKSQGYYNRLCGFFSSREAVIEIVDGYLLESLCSSLITRVNQFIGNDEWNIYFTKVHAVDLKIDKHIDFRIYDWTQMKRQEKKDYHT